MRTIIRVFVALAILAFAAGCGGRDVTTSPELTNTSLPTNTLLPTNTPQPVDTLQPTSTPVPPTSTPSGPPPAPGTGNVTGRILWNGQPVPDLEVRLCEEVSLVRGCSGLEFSIRTTDTGSYLFTDISPGDYGLVAHALDTDRWLYVTTGLGPGARKYNVAADQILDVGDHHIYKFDLRLTTPSDSSQVNTATPSLAWEPYPYAAYYELYLTPEKGKAIFVNQRIDGNQITLEIPLLSCKYTWNVEAFNAQGTKIAETDGYHDFSVTGQAISCYVQITAPLAGATVSGSALSLSWEPHPLASSYRILMWNDTEPDRPKVLDFVEVREPRYAFSDALAPARYVWSIHAYDEDGEQIAGSQTYNFTVTSP